MTTLRKSFVHHAMPCEIIVEVGTNEHRIMGFVGGAIKCDVMAPTADLEREILTQETLLKHMTERTSPEGSGDPVIRTLLMMGFSPYNPSV